MTDFDFKRGSQPDPEKWPGLAELDRALAQNRLTQYRWKKAWADPINRIVLIVIVLLLAGFVGFVIVSDLIIGH